MSDNKARIELTAVDKTRAAFDSAKRNLTDIRDVASRLSGALSLVGIAGAGGLAAVAKSSIDAADALNDLSDRTGVSVKTLAEWKLAADLSDTSIEALGKGVQKLTLSIGQAEGGAKAQAEALTSLGVTARDPKLAFEQLADAVANSNDPIRTNADLQDVLGKNYSELLPLLQQGAQGLRDSAAASASFAESMAALAPEAARFNDQLDELKLNAAAAAASILSQLVPSLNEYIAVGKEVVKNGTMLDKVRFFGLGNASDEIVERVRINLAASAGWMDKLRNSAARANAEGKSSALDPGKTKTPAKVRAAPQLIDALGSGSFKTYSKDVADAIKIQQDAINALNSEIARTVELYDALGSGSYLTGDTGTADFIREQQDAINDLNGEIAASMQESAAQIKETKSAAEEFGLTFTSALEDALVSGASFSDMLKGLEQDIARLIIRKSITEPLMGLDFGALLGGILPSADGNAFAGVPGLSAYSGSVVDRPTLFPFAAGAGLMGEAGPEAILPLKRGADGKLGISGGGGAVQVNVINNAGGTQATASEREENGVRIVDVMVEQVEGAMSRRLGRGEGLAPVMERRYGLNPAAGAF